MSGSYYDLAKLKPVLRSMVMSHRNKSMTVHELERDFKAIEGFSIPYKQLGFTNLFNLLLSMPDIVQVTLRNGYPTVTYVSTAAVEHVEHLIQRSKKGRNAHVRFAYSPKKYDRQPIVSRVEPFTARQHSELDQPSPKTVSPPKNVRGTKPAIKDAKEQSNKILVTENQTSAMARHYSEMDQPSPATVSSPNTVRGTKPAIKDANEPSNNERVEQIPSNENQPPAVEQILATENQAPFEKEVCEYLEESCEHVGTMMGWKPSTDEWDTVNMMGLSPNVMHLADTIPKMDLSCFFREGKETKVRIQHIFNPNRIWLRSMAQELIMKQLTKELHKCYDLMQGDDMCLEPSRVLHGLYCAALIDGHWYRARIVGPLIGALVKVFFIDTGLLEHVNYKHIKFLFKAFRVVPALAIRASLACLIPDKNAWTRAESDSLATLIASYGETPLIAYPLTVNRESGVVDIVLLDKNMNNISETFAEGINARWTGACYLSQKHLYRKKRPTFNEKHPSFFCLEEGHFPTLGELRRSQTRSFDFEEYYTRMPHFVENGVVEKVGREANEMMVKLYGIVSVMEEEEMEFDRTSRVGGRVE